MEHSARFAIQANRSPMSYFLENVKTASWRLSKTAPVRNLAMAIAIPLF